MENRQCHVYPIHFSSANEIELQCWGMLMAKTQRGRILKFWRMSMLLLRQCEWGSNKYICTIRSIAWYTWPTAIVQFDCVLFPSTK